MSKIKPLYMYKQTPMSKEMVQTFLGMSLMEAHSGQEEIGELHRDLMTDFGAYPIMAKRLQAVEVEATPCLLAFCSTICGTPAEAVMYAHAIACIGKRNGRKVDISDFSVKFSQGFPDPDEMIKAWDAQKKDGMNMIDFPSQYPWAE